MPPRKATNRGSDLGLPAAGQHHHDGEHRQLNREDRLALRRRETEHPPLCQRCRQRLGKRRPRVDRPQAELNEQRPHHDQPSIHRPLQTEGHRTPEWEVISLSWRRPERIESPPRKIFMRSRVKKLNWASLYSCGGPPVKPPNLPALGHGYVACFARPTGRGELPFHCVQLSCSTPPATAVSLVQKCAFHCVKHFLVCRSNGRADLPFHCVHACFAPRATAESLGRLIERRPRTSPARATEQGGLGHPPPRQAEMQLLTLGIW